MMETEMVPETSLSIEHFTDVGERYGS